MEKLWVKSFYTNNNHYVFNGNTFDVFRVENETEYEEYLKSQNEVFHYEEYPNTDGVLAKLVLNLSNKCNLKCIYCYAHYGNYGREDNLMSIDTVNSIIKNLKNRDIKEIEIIELFGGEPCLNFNMCEITRLLYDNFRIKYFMITTNGTVDTDKILPILDYPVKFVVSLDGPEDITDILRGKDTYKKAFKFIEFLQSYGIDIEVSCTYTKLHNKYGYTKEFLIKFFKDKKLKFHINNVISNDKNLELNRYITDLEYKQDVENTLDAICNNYHFENINPRVIRVLQGLLMDIKSYGFCDNLYENCSLNFDYDGSLFNCFKLWGDDRYKLEDNDCIESLKVINTKNSIKKCKECWCKYLCNFCVKDTILGNERIPYDNKTCNISSEFEMVFNSIFEYIDNGKFDTIIENFPNFIM